jgi:hypothetical protein
MLFYISHKPGNKYLFQHEDSNLHVSQYKQTFILRSRSVVTPSGKMQECTQAFASSRHEISMTRTVTYTEKIARYTFHIVFELRTALKTTYM